jgi:membrane-associated protease RseP (regulator of RpoE activity)
VKSSERRKRREASSTLRSLLAVFVLFKLPRTVWASCVIPAFGVPLAAFAAFAALAPLLALSGCAAHGVGSVGAMLGKDVHTGRLFVREVPPGMAAAAAGVREGDEVIAIDGVPVADLSPGDVHQRLEGTVGSTVVLLVVRDGETRKVDVIRRPLEKP